MEAKILHRSNNAVVVVYDDGTGQEAVIVSSKDVPADARVGDVVTVTKRVISNGTEYGVDWSILLESGVDVVSVLQQALRRYGIWTLQDYQDNPHNVRDAIGTVVSTVHNTLQQAVIKELTHQEY